MAFLSGKKADKYSPEFFDGIAEGSSRSSRIVLGELFRAYQPRIVLDVGCGIGTWLESAAALGATTLRGLDGPWVKADRLRIGADDFERIDFEAGQWPEIRPADLAISLEVAEHLSVEAGHRLVDYLCASAPAVLFSAAVPGQGGRDHRNEQWQSYWAALFAAKGYRPSLALRSAIWNDGAVEFWYQQNTVLYFAPSMVDRFVDDSTKPMDVIHPRLYDIRALRPARRRARWRRFLPFAKK